jgi:hypothetical protein
MGRVSAPGVSDSYRSGFVIGLPPVMKFAQVAIPYFRNKSKCGKFYIVNGTKKWITNGTFADYFVTAVRTGDPGIFGISMLLIERCEGKIN